MQFLTRLSQFAICGLAVALVASCSTTGSTAEGASVPEASRCGYVSDLDLPPMSQDLYPVMITTIDDRSTPGDTNRNRVESGSHILTIAENIPLRVLSTTQDLQRGLMKREMMARAYKKLTVDVKPGTNYMVGAHLLKDKLDNDSIRANEYWEPVVWQQSPAKCF